eukprot:6203887-Pleurochrysis_carterae.AAC.1
MTRKRIETIANLISLWPCKSRHRMAHADRSHTTTARFSEGSSTGWHEIASPRTDADRVRTDACLRTCCCGKSVTTPLLHFGTGCAQSDRIQRVNSVGFSAAEHAAVFAQNRVTRERKCSTTSILNVPVASNRFEC